jgi:UDPglucose 6-dehydrogenase
MGADAVIAQTEWKDYRALDPAKLPPVVIDGRRVFDGRKLAEAGVRYRAVGLGSWRMRPG